MSSAVRGVLALAVVVAGAVAAVWIGAAILTAGYGFDITDEGYYLLSYRWWSSNHLAPTGVQYIYGPIFEALGYDIASLRLFRLVTVVGIHVLFGWSFVRWLRLRRPEAPNTPLWEAAGIMTILAAGGMCFSWLPLSPGYNDVVLLGSLLATSGVLWAAVAVDRGAKVTAWVPAATGCVMTVMVVAKWSSIVVISLIALSAIVVLAAQGIRSVARGIAWAFVGSVITAGLMHLLVVSLNVAIPGIFAVNRLIANTSHSPSDLLGMYWSTGFELLLETVRQHTLLLVAAVVAAVSHQPLVRRAAWVLGMVGIGLSIWRALNDGGLGGGPVNMTRYTVTLLAAVVFTLVTVVVVMLVDRLRRNPEPSSRSSVAKEKVRGWVILGLLTVLPLVHAFGTNSALYTIGFNAFAAWMALMLAVITGIEAAPRVARAMTATVAAAAILAVASISFGGLWLNPYRSFAHSQLTTTASGVPSLASIKLDRATAEGYTSLYERLRPYTQPPGRAVLAFDKIAGIVLLLDGRPVGEAWVSPREPDRTAAGIEADCTSGRPWWGSRAPILLFNRKVTNREVRALSACGLDFASDYTLLAPPNETIGLQVYLPTGEAAGGHR
ncbi:MAG TPA: hypothetical protein VFT31_17925 [Kribbella sp.]|nr:hypothetical protein [Kribbella sp.]